MKNSCESCLMPFTKDPGIRESERYCSYCFKDGHFTYQGDDREEFQKLCYRAMLDKDMNPFLARLYTFLIRFAPRWRK